MSIRVPLARHPDFPCALESIEVEVARSADLRTLALTYLVRGPIEALKLASWCGGEGERRDELWRTTCFEAFVRAGGGPDYYEFNLAPSRDWNAYRFSGYREGMEAARTAVTETQWEQRPPLVHQGAVEDPEYGLTHARQTATLDLSAARDLPLDQPWRLGLSAVIEERDGRKSYWALAHPPGSPDFHHEACFALELPAARPA